MAKKAYIGVDGKARKIKKGYIGAPTERYVGKKASEYAVGSSIYLSENGTNVEYLVVHQGLPSSMYDASCDGTWLLRKNAYETRAWHSTNSNNYKNSTINTYLNETYFNLFNANTKSAIKQAKIPYVNGTGNSAVASGSNGLSANVFLLGCYELGWTTSNNSYIPIDGACLSYFSGTAQTDTKRIGYFGADACDWWTRSTYTGNSRNAWYVYRLGSPSHDKVPNTFYVRPALIIDSNTAFDATTNTLSTTTETVPLARKIKKAYIGIGGVARPCWSGGELAYYGTITELSTGRRELAAASNGSYALFAGGFSDTSVTNVVDAYNAALTRSSATTLGEMRYGLSATSIGDYALFGGGNVSSYTSNRVDAYNKSLTISAPDSLSAARYLMGATTVGNYALFAGGYTTAAVATVDAYNTSLTRTTPTALSKARNYLSATTVGDYALFSGNVSSNVVDAYNKSLTRSTQTALSVARTSSAATTIGNYALFGGGFTNQNTTYSSCATSNVVDAYDASLTRSTPTALSVARGWGSATTVENYALFGGGGSAYRTDTSAVDAYDESLTRTIPTKLNKERERLAATTIGNYALFGGGCYFFSTSSNSISNLNVVDAYTVA